MVGRYWHVLAPVAAGFAVFGYVRWDAGKWPAVQVVATTDLGLRDTNATIQTQVSFRNSGRRDLTLSDFRSSCPACLSFAAPGESVSLRPGEEAAVEVHITTHGGPDRPFAAALWCQTNDPRHPDLEVRFSAQIRGRLIAVPAVVDVGSLKPGETVSRRIEVRDTGRGRPFRIGRLDTPAHVRVTAAPPSGGTPDVAFGDLAQVVTVEVTGPSVGPAETGLVRGDLILRDAEGDVAALVVPIRGEVPARITVTPPAVVLPHRRGGGIEFAAVCSLASASGAAPVSVVSVPPELLVTSTDSPGRFRIEWRAEHRPAGGEPLTATVRFRVGADNIEVPVRYLSLGAP